MADAHHRLHLVADLLDRGPLDQRQSVNVQADVLTGKIDVVLLLHVVVGAEHAQLLRLADDRKRSQRLGAVISAPEAGPAPHRYSAAHRQIQFQRAGGNTGDALVVVAPPDRVLVLLVYLGADLVVVLGANAQFLPPFSSQR